MSGPMILTDDSHATARSVQPPRRPLPAPFAHPRGGTCCIKGCTQTHHAGWYKSKTADFYAGADHDLAGPPLNFKLDDDWEWVTPPEEVSEIH